MGNYLRGGLRAGAVMAMCLLSGWADAQEARTQPVQPAKVYVPYEQLKGVFESEKQGVFLPYEQFRRLWSAAQGSPAGVEGAPMPYLISTARFTGKVDQELASMQMELTVDVLATGWVEIPIGLGEVGVAKVSLTGPGGANNAVRPLLRVEGGQYRLLTRGVGRYVLNVEFVRQLIAQPGLNILRFRIPAAAINTLELLIPEENMKVDVVPMLAATTTQVEAGAVKSTRLQTFLGATESVELRWQPKTQAAAELAPVIIAEQLQHIDVGEALIAYQVTFNYDIRRRGVDAFTVQLPADFRVTAVEGANISKWDIPDRGEAGPRNLQVNLFSPAEGAYSLTVKMERFLKEDTIDIPLTAVITQQVLRRTGLVAITYSPRRSVELRGPKDLGRVDTDRLPEALRGRAGVTAWRFITSDYGGTLAVGSVLPRITAGHDWGLDVDSDVLTLQGRLTYQIERSGVFELAINLPEPWEVLSVGPADLVDDHRLTGQGAGRMLNVLLKKERTGAICLQLRARAPRDAPDAPVDFVLPAAEAKNLKLYSGRLLLHLAERLRAEVDRLDQLQPLPLGSPQGWQSLFGFAPSMAFQFQAIDRAKPAGARFRVAVKPTQISAVVHQLVDIKPGSVDQEAVVQYLVRYAPVDTFYLKMPAEMADADVQITADPDSAKPRIKEKPRLAALPADQLPAEAATRPAGAAPEPKWAWFKIVLQSPVMGGYQVKVTSRTPFRPDESGQAATVVVHPVLAAGRLSDQSGHVAVAKADTLAVLAPESTNLIPADPGSSEDLPYAPHSQSALLAFKWNAPPFSLSLPVIVQKEAAVFTTMVTGAIIDQKLGHGGVSRTRVVYLIATSRGDRFPIDLPAGATPYQFLVNGTEAAVIPGARPEQRIVRLPPSAGQVSRAVVEVVYGVEGGSGQLAVPTLPKGIPFQQTLWRVWVPRDDVILHHDRSFSPITSFEANRTLAQLGQGWPVAVSFDREGQGEVWNFTRPGAPGKLSLLRMPRRWFYIPVWVIVVAAGVAMLKLSWFRRALVVLGVVLAALVAQLFLPLLVSRLGLAAAPAAGLVVLLWGAHWLFVQMPRAVKARRTPPPTVPPAAPADPSPPPRPATPPGPPRPAEDSPATDPSGKGQ